MSYRGTTEDKFREVIPIEEIQRYEGNCWATTLSMMLRCHGFNVSQKYVTDLFYKWRYDGVTWEQMLQLVDFFNKNLLSKKNWTMNATKDWEKMLQYIESFSPVQVFITGHFVLLLGYDDDEDKVTYFDPWNGLVEEVSRSTFRGYGGGETVYMYKE